VEVKNAVIESVELKIERGGILVAWVVLNYGGSGQQFGGLALYLDKSFDHHEIKSFAGHFLFRCMQIAGVEKWSEMTGKAVRVRAKDFLAGSGPPDAIGHIIKDDWFSPKDDFKPFLSGRAM
jgi:hypothetical protein